MLLFIQVVHEKFYLQIGISKTVDMRSGVMLI